MQIKDPKFKDGQKVRIIEEDGTIFTLTNINCYGFDDDEYWYNLESDGLKLARPESKLELYQEPSTVWDLKEGDTYYTVDIDGSVIKERWHDEDYEKSYRNSGNVFLTKKESESELERRKIEAEMIKLGGRRKFNRGKDNYFIMYTRIEGLDYVNYQSMHEQGVIYFDSELDAINAVKTIGEDKIKKYIFVES